MNLMDDMRERAKADVQRVAFFEGENPTMIKAVAELTAQGLASCVVVGNVEAIEKNAAEQGPAAAGRPRACAAAWYAPWSAPS